MVVFHQLEEPEKKALAKIMEMADSEVGIPCFQRDFVWGVKDISDFLESTLRGYYVGSLLLWECGDQIDLDVEPIYGAKVTKEQLHPRYLVLDGQQRISSFYYAVRAPNEKLWKTTRPYVFFVNLRNLLVSGNKESDESRLVVSMARRDAERRRLMEQSKQFEGWYFPFFEFDDLHVWLDEFELFLEKSMSRDQARTVKTSLRDHLNYVWKEFEIPIIKLPKSMDLGDVAKIFEKLNSSGQDLTIFDLVNARMVKYDIKLRSLWDDTQDDSSTIRLFSEDNKKFPVHVLQTIALLRDKPCRTEDLLKLDASGFKEDWHKACDAIDDSLRRIQNLRDGYGVISPKWLPYTPMIPVLAYLRWKASSRHDRPDCQHKVDTWYWSAIVTHAYSGSTDTQVSDDSKQMIKWFDDRNSVPDTLQQAKKENGLDLRKIASPSDAVYKGVICLIALQGGRDFRNNEIMEFSKLDDHHIFAKSKSEQFKAGNRINSILNKTLIDRETNEKYIRDSKPSEYLRKIMAEQGVSEIQMRQRLHTHLIGDKAFDAMLSDDFDGFLDARETDIESKLKEIMFGA